MIRLVVERVALPDGREASRELVLHPGGVAILPIMPDGRILLVRQYRHAVGKSLWEIPAGKLDVDGETPCECAARELREETGYEAAEWEELFTFYTSPGFTDEAITLFRARGLRQVGSAVPGEIEAVRPVGGAQLRRMIEAGEILDGKTIVASGFCRSGPIDEI